MSKFEPLTRHLSRVPASEYRTTFAEVERILGFKLPPSARRHRPWWSNNPDNSAMTKAWLAAGFRTEQVDMAGERLVFRRASEQDNRAPKPRPRDDVKTLFGALKGTVRIGAGVDLTDPSGEVWDAEQERF